MYKNIHFEGALETKKIWISLEICINMHFLKHFVIKQKNRIKGGKAYRSFKHIIYFPCRKQKFNKKLSQAKPC